MSTKKIGRPFEGDKPRESITVTLDPEVLKWVAGKRVEWSMSASKIVERALKQLMESNNG